MTTNDDGTQRNPASGQILRTAGVVLLMLICYLVGLNRGRSERRAGDYAALKAQYEQIQAQYSALNAEYSRAHAEYADIRSQCEKTIAQYTVLKAEYDRIEAKMAARHE
jgi:hypothetical protein